jgi:hypothetical protein
MPSCSSVGTGRPGSFVPAADANPGARDAGSPLMLRPTSVGPFFDEEHSHQPIGEWDDAAKNVNYTGRLKPDCSTGAPEQPQDFSEKYLFPTLAKNERQRLTMLWYYTRDLGHDHDLMKRLQEKIDIVKDHMGWEFAIMGIMSNDSYTRISTSGLPLAMLPRREATCAHTINQEAGVSAEAVSSSVTSSS